MPEISPASHRLRALEPVYRKARSQPLRRRVLPSRMFRPKTFLPLPSSGAYWVWRCLGPATKKRASAIVRRRLEHLPDWLVSVPL